MKSMFVVAASLALAGCATRGENALVESPAADGHYYCWEDRVVDTQGKYFCNWSANARQACDSTSWEYLEAAAVTGTPQRLRRCENGEHLVVVEVRGDRRP